MDTHSCLAGTGQWQWQWARFDSIFGSIEQKTEKKYYIIATDILRPAIDSVFSRGNEEFSAVRRN